MSPQPLPGRAPGLFARVVAFIVGLGALVISVIVGSLVLAAVAGFVLVVGLVVYARLWWLRRQMQRQARPNDDVIEAEYKVVQPPRERRNS